MGFSSKKQTQTSSEKVGPSDYAKPYIDQAAGSFGPAYQDQLAIAKRFQPGLDRAGQYYDDALSGKFLDGNPHLQSVIDFSNRDIRDNVASTFEGAGRYGSGYHQGVLADSIARNESDLRYGDYNRERQYQDNAGSGLAGIAGAATDLAGAPARGYAGNVGGLLGRFTQTDGKSVSKSSGSPLSSLARFAQLAALGLG